MIELSERANCYLAFLKEWAIAESMTMEVNEEFLIKLDELWKKLSYLDQAAIEKEIESE